MKKFIIDETRQILDSPDFQAIYDEELAKIEPRWTNRGRLNLSPDARKRMEQHALREAVEEYVNKIINNDNLTDPQHFAALAELTLAMDTEGGHQERDRLMEELLRRLGYGAAIDIISDAPAWYA